MRLADFDYYLPPELIAQYPLSEREAARMLVAQRQGSAIEHRLCKDIIDYLQPDDILILNDTKVMPCRLLGRRLSGGKVEVLLLNRLPSGVFKALIKPARLKVGERIVLSGGVLPAVIKSRQEIEFDTQNLEDIYSLGSMPLPPYIKRASEALDVEYYQTVYALHPGAVAAPTAGLHFTQGLLRRLEDKGVRIGYVTLHVGLGTFKPVKAESIEQHVMDAENFVIPEATRKLIDDSRGRRGRIFAVGTTSARALEAYAAGQIQGETSLFIYPGYSFKLVDCLLTNFHLPKTTLLMLVAAFMGRDFLRGCYQEAINQRYRFYSYGDAMLII